MICFLIFLPFFLHLHETMQGLYIISAVGLCVCQWTNSSWKDAPTWTWFSLNGCLPHWLGHDWNLWPLVEGQGIDMEVSAFSEWFLFIIFYYNYYSSSSTSKFISLASSKSISGNTNNDNGDKISSNVKQSRGTTIWDFLHAIWW